MIFSGSQNARAMIVGEAPGANEEREGKPFVGAAGWELDKMLAEAGLARSDFFVCNVTSTRPPNNDISEFFLNKTQAKQAGVRAIFGRYPAEPIVKGLTELREAVTRIQPQAILAVGNTPLWALTGLEGIMKWRGSELQGIYSDDQTRLPQVMLVPVIHSAAILREWALRPTTVHDLRRFARDFRRGSIDPTPWEFLVRPKFQEVIDYLRELESEPLIACDIETRSGHIATVGIGRSRTQAISIPFMCVEGDGSFWSENEELLILEALRRTLILAKRVVFQNGAYDLQYFAKEFGFLPNCSDDTMIMQHVLFPGLPSILKPKSLNYIASMHCQYYRYWKDDGKLWDSSMPEDDLWRYNCEDCCRTFESFEGLSSLVDRMGLREQYTFQMSVFRAALKMMLRGLRTDLTQKAVVAKELKAAMVTRQEWLKEVLGHDLNVRSTPQMQALFYEDFRVKPTFNRKTKRRTLDDEALTRIGKTTPLLRPLTDRIGEIRSLGVFKSTFAEATVSDDLRMRTTINLTGTETFRFSSSEDAFGTGTNLQNLPKGTEDE